MNYELGIKTNFVYSKNLGEVWKEEIVMPEKQKFQKWIFVLAENIPQKIDFKVRLKGRGSRAEIVIAYLGKDKDSIEMNITLVHDAPETYGRITARAALFNESRFIFKGMLDIAPNGKGSDSYLSAKALLLSPNARAEIYPYLEIKTDEIKASHGSSIGRIDENQLFYLQSRGVAKEEAERIILSGFFREIAREMPQEYGEKFSQIQTK
ncbi:MAG: FeS cluster assembly protein sufD [Parcubacteria group bacterium Gr01-1014_33]|nr:MAG: FeS cluster assembly protein sufD [Parcubacteria group bacterium Gr01-1014_33]